MTEASAAQETAADRQRWMWLAAMTALVVGLYWQTVFSLHERWAQFDQSYSHGYLLLGLTLYFVWLQRFRLAGTTLRFSPLMLAPLLLASAGWCIAQLLGVQIVAQMLLPAVLLAAVGTVFGYSFARCFLVPLGLLYLGIPIWDDILGPPLRDLTVRAVGTAFQMVSFPANVTGYRIEIPDGAFYVAGSCSGLAFFLTGVTISVSYAFLNLSSNFKRAIFIVFCTALSMVSNWVRVGGLVVIGHVTKMQSPLITESHLMYGWYLFAGAMVIMLLVGHLLARRDTPNDFGAEGDERSTSKPSVRALLLVATALASGPLLATAYFATTVPLAALHFAPPVQPSSAATAAWQPDYHGWTANAHGSLVGRQTNVDIDILYYARQTQSDKLIGWDNHLADGKLWHVQEDPNAIDADGEVVNEAILRRTDGARRIVWFWYDIGGARTVSGVRVKALQLRRLFTRGRADGAFAAVSVDCAFDCGTERAVLGHTIASLREDVAQALKTVD